MGNGVREVDSRAALPPVTEERMAWLGLVLTPGLGPLRILRLIHKVGSARRVLDMPLTELEAMNLPATSAQFVNSGMARKAADEELERMVQTGAGFLTHADDEYPTRLREIYDAPPVLWLRGDARLLSRPSIAVVGTRHPSPYGTGMAEMLARDLSANGMLILSGMARGVDTAAHKGSLAAKKPTVAVWGTGVDVIYPKENKSLAEQIVSTGGAIVSELPLGTFPAPQNFPKRNRILSGLSVGVLVVEGGEFSGTRVTARCAIEQNRDVFAVPGNVTNKNAWGPNTLIKQGAKLTATWEDVWEELPTDVRLALDSEHGIASQGDSAASLFEDKPIPAAEESLLRVLKHDEALQMEEILEKLEGEMSSSEIFTALFELELSGRIRQLPGKNYVKSFPASLRI
jgi:DNA processing protein